MQDNSWTTVGRLLRVAASFNPAVEGTLRDKAAQPPSP